MNITHTERVVTTSVLQTEKTETREPNIIRKASSSKALGIAALILAVLGFLIFAHRLSYYVFEYDARYSPVDYGKYNILSFFTVQSNFFTYIYLVIYALALFGNKKARRIAFNPTVVSMITTYILLTGIVYCCGIPLGFTPPFKWDTAAHSMSSFIQVYYHMIIPPIMLVLSLFPMTDAKINKKSIPLIGIYPLAYSLFSIVRGAFSSPAFYPYPFYNPHFIFELLCKNSEYSPIKAYLLMLPVLAVGIGLFVLTGKLISVLIEKRAHKS